MLYYVTIVTVFLIVTSSGAPISDENNDVEYLIKKLFRSSNNNDVMRYASPSDDIMSFANQPRDVMSFANQPNDVMHFAGQPGDGPKHFNHAAIKRSQPPPTNELQASFAEVERSCSDKEWFVIIGEMPACVDPLWHVGYDPTFCNKMKNGWIFCGCDADLTPGMAEGIDTCINKEKLSKEGRCSLEPCPAGYECIEREPGVRFDCVNGDTVVPTWYGS